MEYKSNKSLGAFTVAQTEPGHYRINFHAEYPGRFPVHIMAVDVDGNATESRVPFEVYWAKQPFEIQGIKAGFPQPPMSFLRINMSRY